MATSTGEMREIVASIQVCAKLLRETIFSQAVIPPDLVLTVLLDYRSRPVAPALLVLCSVV